MKKLFCINCNNYGHKLKECLKPIYSYGIICIKIDSSILKSPYIINNCLLNKTIDIDDYNFSNISNLSKIDKYKDKIKFLLVRRKFSFSFIEFIRGKYDDNVKNISKLLNLMSKEEINMIIENEFDILWCNVWQKTALDKSFCKEYQISKIKFNNIKTNHDIYDLVDITKLYLSPEWGFPKGRKDKNEKKIDCAMREFEEETGISKDNYIILDKINTVDEIVVGTQFKYKLVYYLGLSFTENELELSTEQQQIEIGDLRWFTYDEVIPIIRDYYNEKILLIHKVYFIIINLLENIQEKSNKTKKFDNLLI